MREESAKLPRYLVVIGDAAVGRRGGDLRRGGSEVTGWHDAGLCHTKAKDQVVTPQRDVVVTRACRAGLLGIHRTAAERQEKGLEQGFHGDDKQWKAVRTSAV